MTPEALGTTMGSAVDAVQRAIMAAAQLPSTSNQGNETLVFSELQSAVEALTGALERLATVPDTIEEAPTGVDQAARRKIQEPHLARELRQLLQEIGTAR